jgi:uncharacterized membrane protein YdjX (TVP38/TMEM64 family)
LLVLFSIVSYVIFSDASVRSFVAGLSGLSYLGIFIAGLLFSFGFSTPFAIGFFLVVQPENIFLASVIGGVGAMLADLTIFNIMKFSFMDEFKRLEKTPLIREFHIILKHRFFSRIKLYVLYVCAGLIIASPLPDEIGVSMLAGLTKIKLHLLALISFIMNTLGILVMLWLGS